MAFTVLKTQEGITNRQKLHRELAADSALGPIFDGMNFDGTDTIEFIFTGTGPLSTSEEDGLEDILENFVNEETEPPPAHSQEVSAPADFSTTSSTPVPITGVSSIPNIGQYFISFTGTGNSTASQADISVRIQKNGVSVDASVREITTPLTSVNFIVVSQTFVWCNGTDEITVALGTSAGTMTISQHTMCLVETL